MYGIPHITRMRSYHVKKIQAPTGPTGAKLPLKSLLCFNISKHVWHLSAKYIHRSVQNPFRYWHLCACHALYWFSRSNSRGSRQSRKWATGLDHRNRFYHLLANKSTPQDDSCRSYLRNRIITDSTNQFYPVVDHFRPGHLRLPHNPSLSWSLHPWRPGEASQWGIQNCHGNLFFNRENDDKPWGLSG